ncbi:hypothetical protein [Streptomyces spongiae]|uniref:Uncharacterized protein n=1 Tax=Streptomyces spongiae TaxID=565072 RepID=A0A5N8XE57_9ACTN|nr:hypothetical protein [Streptomyces spongiae]MPY57494.1 hypothetical protein [Streptomyces spongiae]
MDVNGSNGSPRAARYQSPKPCPGPTLPLLTPDGRRPVTRPADPTDNREQAVLMRAFAQANTDLAKAQEALGEKGTQAVGTFQDALTAIDAVERFEVGRSARQAQREVGVVRTRHADDGPESLRRPPRLWRFLLWPTILAGVGFDTVFVGTIMQRFFRLAPGEISYKLAYLPAFGVAVTLLAAGTLLAEAVFRLRVRADRRTERVRRGPRAAWKYWIWPRPTRTESRRPNDLPWANLTVPVLFTVLLFVGLGTIARIRAADGAQGSKTLVQAQDMVVILILVLSAATVIVKILAHNPYADREKEAKTGLEAADKRLRTLVAEARKALVQHSTAWHRLRAAAEQTSADAYRVVDDACVRIIEERAESGTAGSFDLPLRDHTWPVKQERNGPATPRLRLEVLEHVYTLLERYAPHALENWLEEIAERLNAQFTLPDTEPVAVTPAEPADAKPPEPDAADTAADAEEAEAEATDTNAPDTNAPDTEEPGTKGPDPEEPGTDPPDTKGPDRDDPSARRT